MFQAIKTKQLRHRGVCRTRKTNDLAMHDIHFGNMILRELRKQRYSVSWFAKEMGSDRSNMYKLLARPHLNTDFVLRASRLLRHDFFGEASTQLLDKSCACGENNNILW